MKDISVAALQLPLGGDEQENIEAVGYLITDAAEQGAQIILPPELFTGLYFCKTEDEELFALAKPIGESNAVLAMQKLAKQLNVAIPSSFFERDGNHYYNSIPQVNCRFCCPDRGIFNITQGVEDDARRVLWIIRRVRVPSGTTRWILTTGCD